VIALAGIIFVSDEDKSKMSNFARVYRMAAGMFELLITAVVLAITTAIAGGFINLPYAVFSSPLAIVILVIAAVGAFTVAPVVGLALVLLTAVLFFKRNVDFTFYKASAKYGEASIPRVPSKHAIENSGDKSGPREYSQFAEMDPANPMLGPISNSLSEPFVPAPFNEQEVAPFGSYPIDSERASSSGEAAAYTYRPDADTGDNAFQRIGPDIDVKKEVFKY